MSEGTFNQSVRGAGRYRSNVGLIGGFDIVERCISGAADHPQSKQVTTMTVPNPPDATALYTVTENGTTIDFTTSGAPAQVALGEGLVADGEVTPEFYTRWVPTYAAGVLTFTGQHPGIGGAFTNNAADTTNDLGAPSTTAAVAADSVGFGLALISDGFVTNEGNQRVWVPTTGDFDAQVVTHTIAAGAGDTFQVILSINGQVYTSPSVPFDTNADTTAVNIAAAIETLAPADVGVVGTSSTNTVISTAEVPGSEFTIDIVASGPTAVAAKALTTGPSAATSLQRAFVGISRWRSDVEELTHTGDDPAYKGTSAPEVVLTGRGWLQRVLTETWVFGDHLYVSLAAADKGTSHNAAGTERVWMPPNVLSVLRSEPSTQSNGVGYVALNAGV